VAESKFTNIQLPGQASLPVVQSTEVDGFFETSTRLEGVAQQNFKDKDEAEVVRQGIVDGQQGKFNTDLLYAPTFRGKAYTGAAQKSFLDTVELNATKRMQEIIAENPNDHDKAKSQISGYLNGVVGGFPPNIRERLGQTFLLKSQVRANVGLNGLRTAERKRQVMQEEVNALQKDNQRSVDVVANAEHVFDDDPRISLKSVAAIVEQRSQITSDYGAEITDPDGNVIGAHNPAFRERALQQFDADTSNSAIKSAFNKNPNKEEFLRKFEANEIDLTVKNEKGGVALDLRPDVRRKSALVRYMTGVISRENVGRNAQLRQFKAEVKSDINVLKKGGQLSDKKIALMKTRAHQLGDEESFAQMSDWVSHSNDMHSMSVMTPTNLDALVSAERADLEDQRDSGGPISATDVEQMVAKEELLSNMTTELNKDQLEWANHVGLVETTPIIPTAEETIEINGQQVSPQELMNRRIAQAEAVGAHYGRPPKYLKAEEVEAFRKFLTDRNTSPDAKLGFLASLVGFGDRQDEVLAEVSPKSPEYMHIAGMMKQGVQHATLSDAMEGLSIIQGTVEGGGIRVMRQDSLEAREAHTVILGSAYEESPETHRQVLNTAEAIYTARMFRKGKTDPSEFADNVGEYAVALQEASGANFIDSDQYGGITSYHDKHVHVPSWFEAGKFQDFIAEMTADDYRDAAGGGAPVIQRATGEIEQIDIAKEIEVHGDDIKLISIGDGQYIVSNEASGTSKIYGAQADPFSDIAASRNGWYVLDLNKLSGGRRIRHMKSAKANIFEEAQTTIEETAEKSTATSGGSPFEGIEETAPELIEKGKEALQKAGESIEGASQSVKDIVDKALGSLDKLMKPTPAADTKTDDITGLGGNAPRGLRNNNPGNIKHSNNKWQGASRDQSDPTFVKFDKPVDGLRAMGRVLINYNKNSGIKTLEGIIKRWAPPQDNNDTESYIKSVSQRSGVSRKAKIDFSSTDVLAKIMDAMIVHENGENPHPIALIKQGIEKAKK